MGFLHHHLDEALRDALGQDLAALAEEVAQLETTVAGSEPARAEYLAGVDLYAHAEEVWRGLAQPEDALPLVGRLKEARFRMATARARAASATPPEHRDGCFFDTAHGPACGLIAWTPPRLDARTVPACAACFAAVESGAQPEPRRVASGHRTIPFWDGGGDLAYWFQGWFGVDGECVPALMLAGFPLGGRFTDEPVEVEVRTFEEIFRRDPSSR